MTNSISHLEHELTIRDKTFLAEAYMKTLPQRELPVKHHFSFGVYARELYIPANTTLVGKIHKYQNLNILAKGKMKVTVGNKIELVEAPFTVVSPPGTKRIAHTLEDCIWITIHGTQETDLNLIENEFIAQSEQDYLDFIKQDQLLLDI